jgi:hypothetical protein
MLAIQTSPTDVSGLDCLRQQFHATKKETMEHGAPGKKQITIHNQKSRHNQGLNLDARFTGT